MALLKPFEGLRPPRELVRRLVAPPYDVPTEEVRHHAKGNEVSILRVSRPEIDLLGVDAHADQVHERGRSNLQMFQARGWLRREPRPCYYLYRQRMGTHVQVGLVGCASVDEYDAGMIKKHELTRPDREENRTRHLEALAAHEEPVFLTYRADHRIDALVAEHTRGVPEYDFTTEDGIEHTFWVVPEEANARIAEAFHDIPHFYIADGHHRSAAASRALANQRARGEEDGEHGLVLVVAFPHDQLRILDYHRVVKDLNGRSPEQLLTALQRAFVVEPSARKKPSRPHDFGMYLDTRWYTLTARPGSFEQTPTGALDASILQENLLGPLLAMGDPRTDPRLQFVGGGRGMAELERRVDSGEHQVAFSMLPPRLEELMAIADAGKTMPPKSTCFEPKLLGGLVVHAFGGE
jgi:uncharacterized protein (DUF1015 family)